MMNNLTRSLGVGIVGAGYIAGAHAFAVKASPLVHLVAVCDRVSMAAEKLSHLHGCVAYSDAAEMFRREDISLVIICLPTFLHEEYMCMAAAAGKHVLCEKPFALEVSAAQRMVAAAHENHVQLMVAQVVRFWPEYRQTSLLARRGQLGKLKMITARRLSQFPKWSEWFSDPKKSGGALFDLHLHDIDYLCALMGSLPHTVYAAGQQSNEGAWDQIFTTMTFANGTVACVQASNQMPTGYPFTMSLSLSGETGTLEYCYRDGESIENRLQQRGEYILYTDTGDHQALVAPADDPYCTQIGCFADFILNGKEDIRIPPEDSVKIVELLCCIRQSLQENRVITL